MEQLGAHGRTILRVPAAANARVRVEVAVDSVAGAVAAAAAGADRIELCQDLGAGGLTPTPGLVDAVRSAVSIPVMAMVRPRPGDFLYDAGEWDTVLRDAAWLAARVDGIVGGALRADGALDRARLAELAAAAAPLPLTCHRAFDLCADALAAIDALAELGVARVLTSGQAPSAAAGAALLRACVQRAGDRMVVVAGGGVRPDNVRALLAATGVREVHLSASTWQPSAMVFRRDGVPMGSPPRDELTLRTTDGALVAAVVAAVRR